MNFLSSFIRKNYKNIKCVSQTVHYLSTHAQTLPQTITDNGKADQLYTRVIKKKSHREPFMKNLFLGDFDTEILGFPEALNNEELNQLNLKVSAISSYISELKKKHVDHTTIPKNVFNELKRLKIFGLQAPEMAGGLELSETENCRVFEAISQWSSLAMSLTIHQYFGVQAVIKKGSQYIKDKYLTRLSAGDDIAAFCLLEEDNLDPMQMKTEATKTKEGNFILNGSKAWVINGSQGGIYIVLALTEANTSANMQDRMSVLLVEKSFGGITTSPCNPSGLKSADICNVIFNNTPVPKENVLGTGGDSMKIITSILSGLRLSTGPTCIALMHDLTKNFASCALNTKNGSQYISDTDFIHEKIAEINLDLYAMESMTYMTAGLLDRYEEHDCELESAIVKVFSSEKCLNAVQQCMKLSGSPAFMQDHWLNKLYNDTLGHVMMNETNGSLRMIIALLGLQYAGSGLNNQIKKSRNPLFYPGFFVKKIWDRRRQEADNPKLYLQLESYVHPTLVFAAQWLEYCVYRLQYATEVLLIRHGPNVVEQHMELRRLADVAMYVYAMTAVVSRASRSYCIGLRNADYELLLANAFCLNAREIVKRNVMDLSNGPYGTNDINYQKIAGRSFEYNGYFPEHALTKNF